MDGFIIDEKSKLDICSNSPICSGTKLEHGEFIKPKNEDEEFIDCHKCDSQMELKLGRFGKYFACQNESCPATRQLLKNGDLIFNWRNGSKHLVGKTGFFDLDKDDMQNKKIIILRKETRK